LVPNRKTDNLRKLILKDFKEEPGIVQAPKNSEKVDRDLDKAYEQSSLFKLPESRSEKNIPNKSIQPCKCFLQY